MRAEKHTADYEHRVVLSIAPSAFLAHIATDSQSCPKLQVMLAILVIRVNMLTMKTITIEDAVFAELDKLTTEFFSHSDVIRKLLSRGADLPPPSLPATPFQVPENGSIVAFVQSAEYRMLTSGINKYLTVLGWLYKTHTSDFQKVENYRRGNRVYFARNQRTVEEGGKSIHAKQIPHTPVWTLATLDNRTKRIILTDLLPLFGFKPDEINAVVSTISDSGRHRGSNLAVQI